MTSTSASTSASKSCRSSNFTIVNEPLTESGENKLGTELATVQKPLPPQDGGREAWSFLAAEAVTLQLTWGFTTTFGVFRQFYFEETGSPFAGVQVIAEIGVMATVSRTLQFRMKLNSFVTGTYTRAFSIHIAIPDRAEGASKAYDVDRNVPMLRFLYRCWICKNAGSVDYDPRCLIWYRKQYAVFAFSQFD